MCGRFVSARKRLELLEEFGVQRDQVAASPDGEPGPDYNVAPTKRIFAIMDRPVGPQENKAGKPQTGTAQDGQEQARELRVVRWGLVPFWAKEASGGRLINARAETVAVKPAFRRAFAKRRCLIPADGYYEWQSVTNDDGKKIKQPYFIYRTDQAGLAFAGIYELWRDGSVPDDHEKAWLWTAAVITTQATDDVGQIHDRMPMVIEPDHWDDWLDPGGDPGQLQATMRPAMAGGLTSHLVSLSVNSVRNNGPELVEPLPS